MCTYVPHCGSTITAVELLYLLSCCKLLLALFCAAGCILKLLGYIYTESLFLLF